MKTIAICLLLTFGSVWSLQAKSPRFFPFARLAARKACSAVGDEEFCSTDCKSMVFCNGLTEEPVNCQAATGKPFCQEDANGVSCTTDSSTCSRDDEKCPIEEGEFPNVMDCTKFVSCLDGKPTDYECLPNFVYNGGTKMCMPNTKCYNYNSYSGLCKGKINIRLAYPLKNKLFVYCTETGPKLRRCRGMDGNHIYFDSVSKKCTFVCPGQAKYADWDYKEYYYECVQTDTNVFTATRKKCPPGMIYDGNVKECRKGSI